MKNLNKLKKVLKKKKYTQRLLAEKLGVYAVTVNYWCQNTHQPSLKRLQEIANLLNIKLKELI